MVIRNNVMAMTTHRHYNNAFINYSRSIMRLSTGLRINSAADDPAGLAISEKMRAQIRGLAVASRNCQDAVSLIQTAEGALQSAHDILQRLNEIAVQAASDTNEGIDRNALNEEFQQLLKELNEISGKTQYNGSNLLDGSRSNMNIQSGPNQGDSLGVSIGNLASLLAGLNGADISTREGASNAIDAVKDAANKVSTERAKLGAMQNRLEYKISYLDNAYENLSEAESRIRDVDFAREVTEMVKYQILMQAAMAMMAQANSMPRQVLQLLSGI